MNRLLSDSELRRMVAELPHPEPPKGFADATMARIRAEERRRRRRPWFLAAAAAVLVASGLLVSRGTDPSGELPAAPVTAGADDPARELEALREEVRRLGDQLALMDALMRAPSDPAPGRVSLRRVVNRVPDDFPPLVSPVRIGGTDELGVFLDLESFLDDAAFAAAASSSPVRVLPASDRPRR